ncbi:MAG: hypothetical protein H6834_14050 [Planctomycetes bacterium]|nr:hypothetical protein [Planctomycetota bacterium]
MSAIAKPQSAGSTALGPGQREHEATTLRLDELETEALAGEGNYVYKIPFGDGHAVLKIYYGSRSRFLYWHKSFKNLLFKDRSSHMPRARCAMEIDCIRTWEGHGFRCFGMYENVRVEGVPERGYMVYEYVPGLHFRDYFRNAEIPLEERMATWRRWVPDWFRRHRLAVDLKDPRLIQDNGDVKHVMLWEGGFVYFDFEIIKVSKNMRDLVGREILAYMRSVGKFFGEEIYERMLTELIAHYPDKVLLHSAWEAMWFNKKRSLRLLRALDRLKRESRKRWSKYYVGLDIKRRLEAEALGTRPLEPGSKREARALRHLDSNQVWRVDTPSGPVVQKYYVERSGLFGTAWKRLATAVLGRKTSPAARARRATEGELLRRWNEAGFDVPKDLTAEHLELGGDDVRVLEFVEGGTLLDRLRDETLAEDERAALLERFMREWSRRHRHVVDTQDPAFLMEHATLHHVLVSGDRFVTYDLEQAFRKRGDVLPHLAKEVAGCLRSLAKGATDERLRKDLETIVATYEPRELLERTVAHYLHNTNPWKRRLWSVDRSRRERGGRGADKYRALTALDAVLRSQG